MNISGRILEFLTDINTVNEKMFMYDELKKIKKDLECEEYTDGAIGFYFV